MSMEKEEKENLRTLEDIEEGFNSWKDGFYDLQSRIDLIALVQHKLKELVIWDTDKMSFGQSVDFELVLKKGKEKEAIQAIYELEPDIYQTTVKFSFKSDSKLTEEIMDMASRIKE